jgi:hypothetical protein
LLLGWLSERVSTARAASRSTAPAALRQLPASLGRLRICAAFFARERPAPSRREPRRENG